MCRALPKSPVVASVPGLILPLGVIQTHGWARGRARRRAWRRVWQRARRRAWRRVWQRARRRAWRRVWQRARRRAWRWANKIVAASVAAGRPDRRLPRRGVPPSSELLQGATPCPILAAEALLVHKLEDVEEGARRGRPVGWRGGRAQAAGAHARGLHRRCSRRGITPPAEHLCGAMVSCPLCALIALLINEYTAVHATVHGTRVWTERSHRGGSYSRIAPSGELLV